MYFCALTKNDIMKRIFILVAACLTMILSACVQTNKTSGTEQTQSEQPEKTRRFRTDIPLDSIRLSDPCILADKKTNMYYMTGTG